MKNKEAAKNKRFSKKLSPEELKMTVKELIDNLNETSTQKDSFEQFKILLQKFNSLNDIKIIFPLLLNYSNNNATKIGKEYQLILIAYSLSINYIKSPNHNITSKILESIGNFLINNSFNIHKAASISIIEIFNLLNETETKDKSLEFILKYFFNIIEKNHNIINKINENGILNGCFIIINDLITYIIKDNSSEKVINDNPEVKNEIIERANRRIDNEKVNKASDLNSLQQILIPSMIELIQILKKYKYPNPNLLQSICNLIDVISYDEYKNNFIEIIPILINVLYKNDSQIYLSKIQVCEIFSHLKNKLRNLNIQELPNQNDIIKSIEYATSDRVFKVQISANETLNNILNINIDNNDQIYKLNLLRNLSLIKNNKGDFMKNSEVRKKIYEVGIGKFLRTTGFLNNRDEENLIKIKNELEKKRKKELNKSKSKSKEKNKKSIKSFFKGQNFKKNENNFQVMTKYNPRFSDDEISENNNEENEDNKIENNNNNSNKNKSNNNSNKNNSKNNSNNNNSKNNSNINNSNINNSNINNSNNNNNLELEPISDIHITYEKEEKSKSDNKEQKSQNSKNNSININEHINNSSFKKNSKLRMNNSINDNKKNKKEEEEEIINCLNNISSEKENSNYLFKNNNNNVKSKIINKKEGKEFKLNFEEEKIGKGNQNFIREDPITHKKYYNNDKKDNIIQKEKSIKYKKNLFEKLSKDFNQKLNILSNNLEEEINNKLLLLNNRINKIKDKIINYELLKKEQLNDTLVEKSKNKNDNLFIWKKILKYLKNKNYEKAYLKALNTGDDLIFLRLIFLTNTNVLSNISLKTNKKIILRLNQIYRCFMLQQQIVNFCNEFYKLKMINLNLFNENELNDLMQTLSEIGNYQNELGGSAKEIYDKIKESFQIYNN